MKLFTDFITWLKPSFEDSRNTSSSKRLSAFWFIAIVTFGNVIYVWKWGSEFAQNYNWWVGIHLVFILLMFGLINIDQILKGISMVFNRGSKSKEA